MKEFFFLMLYSVKIIVGEKIMKINIIKKKASSLKDLGKETIEIPSVSTLKELLLVIFYNEYNHLYNNQIKTLTEKDIKYLAKLGKISFSNLYNTDKKDLDDLIEIMFQDFTDGLYKVFINGQEYENLNEHIQIEDNDEIVFIRFVMLAGRLW